MLHNIVHKHSKFRSNSFLLLTYQLNAHSRSRRFFEVDLEDQVLLNASNGNKFTVITIYTIFSRFKCPLEDYDSNSNIAYFLDLWHSSFISIFYSKKKILACIV